MAAGANPTRSPKRGGKGVVVTGVDPDGPAADQGFQTGDIILDVGGKTVANARDVRTALTEAKAQGKRDVLMRVKAATKSGSWRCRSAVRDANGTPRRCRSLFRHRVA